MTLGSNSFVEDSPSLEANAELSHRELYQLQIQNLSHVNASLLPLPEAVEQRLEILIRVADILGIDDVSFASFSAAVARLSSEKLSVKRSLNQLEFAEDELRSHLASAKHEERLVTTWTETMQSDHEAGTASLERRKETLIKKAKEYHKQLEVLMAEMSVHPPVTVTDIIAQQEVNHKKEEEIKNKRLKVKAFQGLPPNLELARHELRTAQNELTTLLNLRERLLRRIADGVA